MSEPLFHSAEEYHAHLIAQADEGVARLARKVEKAEQDLADAQDAHEDAVAAATRLRENLPEFVLPTSSVQVHPQ